MKAFSKKEGVFLLVLFILALGVRLIYLDHLQESPMFDAPIMDAKYHHEWAQLVRSNWSQALFQGVSLHPDSAYFRAPLYAYFLALIYTVFDHSYLAVRIIQFLIGSLSVLLIYFLGKRVFGSLVGKIAGVMAALYGIFIYFEGELLIPTVILFLNLLLVLAVLATVRRPRWWRWLGCGALLGLSAMARPNVLIFLAAVIPWMIVRLRRQDMAWNRVIIHGLSLLLGTALLMLPIHVHNYRMDKDFLPTMVSQGGVNFFIGNNRDSDGVTAIVPGTRATWWGGYYDAVQLAQEAEGCELKASEISDYWFHRGLEFLRDEPGAALKLFIRKLALFWCGAEMANNKDIYFFSAQSPLLRWLIWKGPLFFPFGVMAPLALAGMVLAWRRKQGRGAGLLAAFVFLYMVGVVAFFINARFRLPIVPFMLPFAAYGLTTLFRKRRTGQVVLWAAVVLIFGLITNLSLVELGLPPPIEAHVSLGSVYMGKEMYPQAAAEFRRALEIDPQYVRAISGLARVYDRTDSLEKAIELWERAMAISPDMMELHFHAGFSYYAAGRLDQAIAAWQEAARLQPEFAQPHFQLGIAYEDRGDTERAVEAYQEALQVNPLYVLANYNLGHLYKRLGRMEEAVDQFQQAIETNPQYGDAYNSLAWLYAQEEMRLDEGIELMRKALELEPESAAYWDTLAELYIKKGQLDRAEEIFRRMLRERKEPGEDFWRERLEEISDEAAEAQRGR
jgi:pentatricopeptide repeat protein